MEVIILVGSQALKPEFLGAKKVYLSVLVCVYIYTRTYSRKLKVTYSAAKETSHFSMWTAREMFLAPTSSSFYLAF